MEPDTQALQGAESAAEEEDSYSLLEQAIRGAMSPSEPQPEEPSSDEEYSEPEPSERDAGGQPLAGPAGQGDEKRLAAVQHWTDIVLQAPQRISEVRSDMRADVMQAYARAIAEAVAEEMGSKSREIIEQHGNLRYQAGLTAQQQQAQDERDFEELRALRDEDPVEFARIATEEPGRLARFAQAEAYRTSGEQEVVAGARTVLQRLVSVPGAVELHRELATELVGQYGANYFAPTQQGLARLEASVSQALAQAKKGPAAPAQAQQAGRPVHPRQAAAEERSALPRVAAVGVAKDDADDDDERSLILKGLAMRRR